MIAGFRPLKASPASNDMHADINENGDSRANRLNELTALRGFAALAVVCLHAMYEWHPVFSTGSRITNIISGGGLWVHFFFVLSGFVIDNAYGSMFSAKIKWRDYRRFLWLRFGRVYPLYIVLLVVWVLCEWLGWISVRKPPGSLLASIFLVQGFLFGDDVWNYPGWSISAEWLAYCVFPLISFMLAPLSRPQLLRLSVLLSIGIVVVWGKAPGTSSAPWMSAVFCLLEFSLGCVVLKLTQTQIDSRTMSPRIPTWACLLPLLLLAMPPNPLSNWILGIAVIFCALTIYTVTVQETGLDSFLQSKALQFLGVISYSIYLIHALLFRLTKTIVDAYLHEIHVIPRLSSAHAVVAFAGYLALLVLFAWISYRWIEEPARLWFKRKAPKGSWPLQVQPAR